HDNANTFLDDGTFGPNTTHSGSYEATFGAVGTESGIVQTISTVAGHSYHVSFWLQNDDGCGDTPGCSSIEVSFGGITLISNTLEGPYGWRLEQFDVVANGTSSDLMFDIRQDPSYY